MVLFVAIFGLFFVALLVMAMVGAFLPASYRAQASVSVAGDPSRALRAIDDVERWPAWFPEIRAVQLQDEGAWRELGTAGPATVTRATEGTVVTVVTDRLQFATGRVGTRVFEVEASDNATSTVRLKVQRQVPNVFSRYTNRFVKAPSGEEVAVLEALGRQLGERVKATAE